MLIQTVYSPIQLYIRRYTRTHSYIKSLQEIQTYYFHYYLYIHISVMVDRAEERGGLRQEGRHPNYLFYADNFMVASSDP